MKILIIKTAPGEICVNKSTYNHQEIGLARALRKKGHVCDVVCAADGREKTIEVDVGLSEPVTLHCLKATTILKNCFYHKLDILIRQYDILQLSEYNQIYTWYAAKKYRKNTVIYHGPYYCDFNKKYNLMAKVFDLFFVNRYRKLNTCFITKSHLAEEYLRKKDLKNVSTVGVGIDVEALTAGNGETVPFVENTLKNKRFDRNLLYIGRIEPRRNPMFLLDILDELRQRNENVGLILIGTGEKNYLKKFWNYADKLDVSKQILYQDKLEQKYLCQVYPFADVFLLPTIYDIFGMVLLEAMYFSMPVLTTVNGGADMLINDGVNGFVFRDFNTKQWGDCITKLFTDTEKCKKISERACDKVCNEFTWEVLSEKFIHIYETKVKKCEKRDNNFLLA